MERLTAVFLGDPQVGKTSIIRTLLTHSFPLQVPPVCPPIQIPPNPPMNFHGFIMLDLILQPEIPKQDQIISRIQGADILVLVYDSTRPESQNRVLSYWMPLLNQHSETPVIVVANKADLNIQSRPLTEFSSQLISEYPQCYICFQVSAKSYKSLSILLQLLQQRVFYPATPILNTQTKQLYPAFKRALKRIFRLSDLDNDNLLNDFELSKMNFQVTGEYLNDREILKLKQLVGVDQHEFFPYQAFEFLFKKLACELKLKFIWKTLARFDYDKNLKDTIQVVIKTQPYQTVQLTQPAIKYLIFLYQQASDDWNLTFNQLQQIFSTVESPPWCNYGQDWEIISRNIELSSQKTISLYSWISIWIMLTAKFPQIALKNLLLVGYPRQVSTAYTIYNSESTDKNVYQLSLVGSKGVGKKALLRAFLRKSSNEEIGKVVCGMIQEGEMIWNSKYLVISTKQEDIGSSDLVCLMYDNSVQSMQCIKNEILPLVDSEVPKLLVLNKSELIDSENVYPFSLELALKEHCSVNLKKSRPDGLFRQMKELAKLKNREIKLTGPEQGRMNWSISKMI